MDKKTIQKNILDLEYKKLLQTQNVILLFGTTSVLPLISSFVWYPERLALGLLLIFLIKLKDYEMPTITLNKKVVEELAGKKLLLDKLKDRISMLGTDLESVNEKEIVVEIFPNRPDLLSEQGVARAISSFIGVKKGLRNYKSNKSSYKVIIDK